MILKIDPSCTVRSFCSPRDRTATIVTSHIADDAEGTSFGQGCVIVRDLTGLLCDIELSGQDERVAVWAAESLQALTNVASVSVDDRALVRWNMDPTGGYLWVVFDGDARADRTVTWFGVGESFSFAIDAAGELAALFVSGVARDDDGDHEAEWLSRISSASG